MRILAYVRTLATVTGAAGCALPPTVVPPHSRTIVTVHNESSFDIDVFVWDAEERATRLGYLAAGDTAGFEVPPAVLEGVGPYSLEGRVVDWAREPIRSRTFTLRRGYRITWGIPPAHAIGTSADEPPSDSGAHAPVPPMGPSAPPAPTGPSRTPGPAPAR